MPSREAFFLPSGDGQRFCLFTPAQTSAVKGGVIYLHPFAEELNKTRHMATLQARAFAQAGYCVLQIDLLGCGDSSGNFGDASWASWQDDARRAVEWLQKRTDAPLWLWGLRAGALLAAEVARCLPGPVNCLFWQPMNSGQLVLQQFLRLGAAAEILAEGSKGKLTAMRSLLAKGKSIEVAGYLLTPTLAEELVTGSLDAPATTQPKADSVPPRLIWIDLVARENCQISSSTAAIINQWQDAGYSTVHHQVIGPAFWQTIEIETAPALIEATLVALGQMS